MVGVTAMGRGFAAWACACALAWLAGGAARAADDDAGDKTLDILCTTYPVEQIVRNIAGDVPGVKVSRLVAASLGCPHDYQPTPEDLRKLARADVVVLAGMGQDAFAVRALPGVNPGAAVIDAAANIAALPAAGGAHEHDHDADHVEEHDRDHDHGERVNPHWFASPVQAGKAAMDITERLMALDPERALAYAVKSDRFVEEMTKLMHASEALPAGAASAALHDTFSYLMRDFGLAVPVVIQAEHGVDPSMAEVARLVKRVKDEGMAFVIAEPQFPDALARLVAKEAGVPVVLLDPVASGPEDAGPDHYRDTMLKNLDTLQRTLAPEK